MHPGPESLTWGRASAVQDEVVRGRKKSLEGFPASDVVEELTVERSFFVYL
jgi:hypothetical protein